MKLNCACTVAFMKGLMSLVLASQSLLQFSSISGILGDSSVFFKEHYREGLFYHGLGLTEPLQ